MADDTKAPEETKAADSGKGSVTKVAASKSDLAKAVNAWIKEVEKETKVKQTYGDYKAADILEVGEVVDGKVNVITSDYRKFTVSV